MARAIIFDFDGTLADSLESIKSSMDQVLKKYGFPVHSYEEYKMFVGDGIEALVFRALPETARKEKRLRLHIEEYREIYGNTWKNSLKPYPGIKEMLMKLSSMKLILMILSNKTEYFTKIQAEYLFGDINFSIVAGAIEGIPVKPDPTRAVSMAKSLNIETSDTIFVGDSPVDIKTAINAKMKPIGVSWGFRTVETLIDAGAEKILKNPFDILSVL